MKEVKLKVDGNDIHADIGKAILEVCRQNNIEIPTLCYDENLRPIGSCKICTVEVKGQGFVSSCNTIVKEGMEIETTNSEIISFRKKQLEKILSKHYGDCIAPCQMACPAGVDVQGYIKLINKGLYNEATELIKEKLPLPAVIGRICPRPCETACRRNILDEPIAICALKRFVGDYTLNQNKIRDEIKPESGFKIAIIGSGPAGLSAAYYSAKEGHKVTIFEALPKPGGMLRYGIPEYRLPKDILDKEIKEITDMGVVIEHKTLGRDFTIQTLLKDGFNAIFLAIGAYDTGSMRIDGEDSKSVIQGINFLRDVAKGKKEIAAKVVVVGGGNTAIDAARTALRLGAKEVTILYRRSKAEMPANDWEIKEAEEEGIKFHYLACPLTISNNKISCTKMELVEKDSSGRRSPVPVKDSEFIIGADAIIPSIGQSVDTSVLPEEIKTEKGRKIIADPDTMQTSMKGVFAGGDAVTGPATAVQAIAAGRKAAIAIDKFVRGKDLNPAKEKFSDTKGELSEIKPEEFKDVERAQRQKMPTVEANKRKNNFKEMELGFTEKQAKKESSRCLECGCKANYYCKLRDLGTELDISPQHEKIKYNFEIDKSHPFIEIDPNKCIKCFRCVLTCKEIRGIGAIHVNLSKFKSGEKPIFIDDKCVSCGQCVAACPVGALTSKNKKCGQKKKLKTICPYWSVGCGLIV